MKRFKIGFLAVVAILAMSFSIVSQQKASNKIYDQGTCNGTDKVSGTVYDNSCTTESLTCNVDLSAPKFIAASGSTVVGSFTCDGQSEAFCCAEIGTVQSKCNTSVHPITKIICGERP